MKSKKILCFDPADVASPDDISLRQKLDAIPKFKEFMMNTVCVLREKVTAVEYAGNGIHVNDICLPQLNGLLKDVCRILHVTDVPDMSLAWNYNISATTEGARNPYITAFSGAVDLLNDDELRFIIAHEIGHQMSGHKPYHMFLETMYLPLMNSIPGGEVWINLARTKLLNWYRMSDFTADRIGLLAVQDIDTAISTMIKMSGIPKKYYGDINIKSFLKQASEFDSMFSDTSGEIVNYLSLNAACTPWLVLRAAKLYEWYKNGDYQRIVGNTNCSPL